MIKKIIGHSFLLYILGGFAIALFLSSPTSHTLFSKQFTVKTPPFASIENIKEKKIAFIRFLSPLADKENKRISIIREELYYIQHKIMNKKKLTRREHRDVSEKYSRYDINTELSNKEKIQALLVRVNIIPHSLVVAQAAIESGWGTSRFSREAHNYFGQWCYKKGCGITPSRRAQSASHEVKKFDSAYASVAGYMFNINTHRAYKSLRETRAKLQKSQQSIDGIRLAEDLISYSELGEAYVKKVKNMINSNNKLIKSLPQ